MNLASYELVKDAWVQTVVHMKTSSNLVIPRADVMPLFTLNDLPHHLGVTLAEDGSVCGTL